MSIATQISRLQTAKANIKAAIDARLEIPIPTATTLDAYDDYIDAIPSGDGGVQPNGSTINVIAKDVLQVGDVIYTIRGDVTNIYADNEETSFDGTLWGIVFSHSGNFLIIYGYDTAKLYSVSGTTLTFISNIYMDNSSTPFDGVYYAAFSPTNDNLFILFGEDTNWDGYVKLYSISGTTVTYISDIYMDNSSTPFDSYVEEIIFSPIGNLLIIQGDMPAILYTISGTTVTYISTLDQWVHCFSNDGSLLVAEDEYGLKIYSISGTTITYESDIYMDNSSTPFDDFINYAKFVPNKNLLIVTGNFTGKAKFYSISGTSATYISDIGYSGNGIYLITFSQDGDWVAFVDGDALENIMLYYISETAITYEYDIFESELSDEISGVSFSPNGLIAVSGYFSGGAKLVLPNKAYLLDEENIATEYLSIGYSLEDANIDDTSTARIFNNTNKEAIYVPNGEVVDVLSKDTLQIGDVIYTINGDNMLSKNYLENISIVNCIALSPDGTMAIICCNGPALIYTASGSTLTYVSGISLDGVVYTASFSPDGSKLVLGGYFTGSAKIYSVSGTTITFVSDIYADSGTTALSSSVRSASFSPNGNTLVLGGSFTGRAKIYSVSGTTITFVSNIYANTGTTALGASVYSASFSPNGNTLVLGGGFTGGAKIYSVSGTTITLVSDIYADSGTTALSASVKALSFSPNGDTLILGGDFTGGAKIYSVSGTTITFVSNIYADSGTTELDGTVSSLSFSPDGSKLALGGYFIGHAKIYSISGTTVIYIDDLYADNTYATLNDDVETVLFLQNNEVLFIGGDFSKYAIVYTPLNEAYLLDAENTEKEYLSIGYALGDAEINDVITARILDNTSSTNIGGTDTSDANAIATDIIKDKTAYVNGEKITGTAFSTTTDAIDANIASGKTAYTNTGTLLTGTNTATITNPVSSFTINGDYANSTYYTAAGSGYAIMANGNVVIFIQGGTSTSYEHIYFNANSLTGATAGVGFGITAWDTSDPAQVVYACTLTGVSAGRAITVALDNLNSTTDYVRANITVANA